MSENEIVDERKSSAEYRMFVTSKGAMFDPPEKILQLVIDEDKDAYIFICGKSDGQVEENISMTFNDLVRLGLLINRIITSGLFGTYEEIKAAISKETEDYTRVYGRIGPDSDLEDERERLKNLTFPTILRVVR